MTDDPLSTAEIERYQRHYLLPEIGGPGQQRLKAAAVLVIGAGGLGSPVIEYLAGEGVRHDRHRRRRPGVALNLQRQVIHGTEQSGEKKTRSAAARVREINPHVAVNRHETRFDADSAPGLVFGYDLMIDGSDNIETRYCAADAAERAGVTLVSGAVGRFDGFGDGARAASRRRRRKAQSAL